MLDTEAAKCTSACNKVRICLAHAPSISEEGTAARIIIENFGALLLPAGMVDQPNNSDPVIVSW